MNDGPTDTRRGGRLLLGIVFLLLGAAITRHFLLQHSIPGSGRDSEHTNRITVNLLADWRRQSIQRETSVIEFGSPEARRHYREPDPRLHGDASGILSRDFGAGRRAGFACGSAITVTFFRQTERDLTASLEAIGLDDGKGPQTVTASVGDLEVASFDLDAGETPELVTFQIPASCQTRGENSLVLEFGRTLLREFEGVPAKLPFAAVLVRLELADAGGARALAVETVPDLVVEEVAAAGGGPPRRALVFREGDRLTLPVRLEAGVPRFVASLFVHPDDADPTRGVSLVSRLRAARGGSLRIAQATLDAKPGNPRDRGALALDVDLSTYAQSVAVIEIESPPPPGGRKPLRIALADPALRGGREYVEDDRPHEPEWNDFRNRLKGANVVVILLDAASARHFSAYGARTENTPYIASLALEGVVFDGATSPASYTLPSVGSLFTGIHPEHHGVTESGGESERRKLSDSTRTLAERLKDSGYKTVALISNPNAGPEPGYDRGFDVYDRLYDDPKLWDEGVAPEALVDRVKEHIEKGTLTEPFFLYAHFFPPHAPYRPPEKHRKDVVDAGYGGPADGSRDSIEAYRRRGERYAPRDLTHLSQLYDANLHYVDAEVARLAEEVLGDAKLYDDTIFVIVSDHGEAFGEHKNLEHGDTTYSEETEIPLIVRFPRHLTWKPARVRGPCSLMDLAPTVLSMLSVDASREEFDGIDLSYRLFERLVAIRPAERPLISRSAGFTPRYSIRMLGHAYHEDLFTRERQLFNLERDPFEQLPLPVENSPLALYLRQELCRFLCGRSTGGDRIVLTPEEIAKRREIGYLGTTGSGEHAATCPLLNR